MFSFILPYVLIAKSLTSHFVNLTKNKSANNLKYMAQAPLQVYVVCNVVKHNT